MAGNSSRDAINYLPLVEIVTPYRVKRGLSDIIEEHLACIGCDGYTSPKHVISLLRSKLCEYSPAFPGGHGSLKSAVEYTAGPVVAYIVSSSFPFSKKLVPVPPEAQTIGGFTSMYPPPEGMTYVAVHSRRHVPNTHITAKLYHTDRQRWDDPSCAFPAFYSGTVLMFFPVPIPPAGSERTTHYIAATFGNASDGDNPAVVIPTEVDLTETSADLHDVRSRLRECVHHWLLERHIDPTRFRSDSVHTGHDHQLRLGPHVSIVRAHFYGTLRRNFVSGDEGVVVEDAGAVDHAAETSLVRGSEFHHAMQHIVDITETIMTSQSYTEREMRDTLGQFLGCFDGRCIVRIDERQHVCVEFFIREYSRSSSPFYKTFYSRYLRRDLTPVTTSRYLCESEIRKVVGHLGGGFDHDSITKLDLFLVLMMNDVKRVTYTHPANGDDDRLSRAAIQEVRGLDWLYPFQKDTVEEMIRREYSGDGVMGMLNTRVSGRVGDVGTFHVGHYFRELRDTAASVFRVRGGILADEPGLGKTRQTIALIMAVQHAERGTPRQGATLVVVKPNVLRQWQDEITTVWPEGRLAVYHGTKKRAFTLSTLRTDYDIVLTTYSTLVSRPALHSRWRRAVLDESHDMTPRMAALQTLSNTKWCVTGTPIKGTQSLKRTFLFLLGNIVYAFGTTQVAVLDMHHEGTYYMRQLMLRKTLAACMQFPPVPITDVAIEMTRDERTLYQNTLSRIGSVRHLPLPVQYQRYNALINVANFGLYKPQVPGTEFDDAVHPNFTVVDSDDDMTYPPADDLCPICIDAFIDPCVTMCGHWFCSECMHMSLEARGSPSSCPMCRTVIRNKSIRKWRRDMEDADASTVGGCLTGQTGGKIAHILEYLETMLDDDDRQAIVFFPSQFMVDAFGEDAQTRGITVHSVHGRVPLSRRQRIFADFQTKGSACRVIAATTKTMSDGLTMTLATDIIIATPTGRDSIDTQIIGRTNRIGRDLSKPLNIVRYVYRDTIESRFLDEQRRFRDVGCRIGHCFVTSTV